ncbi:MAG: hypothetical protein O3B41_01905 [Bacteroidetes bacterium]|nr:hypothetical protein [Bacteroidota bacterium]
MKSAILSLLLLATLASTATAQKKINPKDLEGTTWEMVFDLKKEANNAIERIALSAVGGFMEEIDIRFDFRKDGALRVRVDAFGEKDDEVDYSTWEVNSKGQLRMGKTETFGSEDTLFMRDGDRLMAYERNNGKLERKHSFYLVRVDN